MFNLDIDKLILWLIPAALRKPVLYAWLKALCLPVIQLYDQFMIRRLASLYRISHNGQVFSMEAMLNDRFDLIARRIYITDGFTKDRIYIYTRLENKPVSLGVIPLYNRSDYADTGVDFIVWIPNEILISTEDQFELRALLNFYKLAGKRYRTYRK